PALPRPAMLATFFPAIPENDPGRTGRGATRLDRREGARRKCGDMGSSQTSGERATSLSRRQALASAGVCALLGTATQAFAAGSARGSRPNILWIVSEDNNPTYIGAYGDSLART